MRVIGFLFALSIMLGGMVEEPYFRGYLLLRMDPQVFGCRSQTLSCFHCTTFGPRGKTLFVCSPLCPGSSLSGIRGIFILRC
jgi:hypothetical protein